VSELNSNSNEYSSLNDERKLLRVYLFVNTIHFSYRENLKNGENDILFARL